MAGFLQWNANEAKPRWAFYPYDSCLEIPNAVTQTERENIAVVVVNFAG